MNIQYTSLADAICTTAMHSIAAAVEVVAVVIVVAVEVVVALQAYTSICLFANSATLNNL